MKHFWTDSFHHARKWSEIAPHAPYRASVPADVTWSVAKMDPLLIAVGVTRGHRMLLAFTREDIRDLFLASYHDEDARPEADMATKVARIPVEREKAEAEHLDLAVLIDRFRDARKEKDRTFDEALDLIVGPLKMALRENDLDRAQTIYSLVRMVGDTLVRTFCVQAFSDAGVKIDRSLTKDDPTIIFDPAWVSALTLNMKAEIAANVANDELQEAVVPEVREMLERGEIEPAKELVERLPGGWCKATASDMIWVAEHPEPTKSRAISSPAP